MADISKLKLPDNAEYDLKDASTYHVATYANTNSNNTGKYYKISINSYTSWMLLFKLSIYHEYKAYIFQISGYNYGTNHWYKPEVQLISSTDTSTMTISFGYDSDWHLWIAFPARQYSGVTASLETNGYQQVDNEKELFTIELVDELTGTVQTTKTCTRPWYRSETVTQATKFSSNREIKLTGDVTGSASTTGESGWSIATTVGDDSHNHTVDTIVPKQSKTYTGIIASGTTQDASNFYFCKVVPEAYGEQWYIKYRIHGGMDGISSANGRGTETSYVYISGMRDTYSAYRTWNEVAHTSYRPYYYHALYRAKEAGISYGHAIGIGLRSSYYPTNATYKRNVTVEIIDYGGCSVSLLDTPVIRENWNGNGTTNYSGVTEFDATTQGNTMSGDRNDVNYYNRNHYGCRTAYAAIYRYQLCLSRKDRSLLPINSVNNSIATNKTLTTETFDPFGEILYWASTTTYNAGANVGDGWYNQYLADIRYSFNIGGYDVASTLVGRKPLYLVCVPQSDGQAKLHTEPLAQELPTTDDGRIYIYLGQMYPDTYPYRLYMSIRHPIYWYKNGAIRPYEAYGIASTSQYGATKLSTATNSTATNLAATPSAVKTAYDLANEAKTTANTALSGVNGNLIYDHTFTISNGVATFTPHVYQKGAEVTSDYAASCFSWKYRLIDGSEVNLTTKSNRGCDVTITNLGYGGHVIGIFTPPAS